MRFLDKAIELSKPVIGLIKDLKQVAANVEKLAQNLAVIAHNQHVHHHMIVQMWNVQQAIFKKMSEGSLDMSMPDIDAPSKKADDGHLPIDPLAATNKRSNKPKPN